MQRRKYVVSAICASLVALALAPDGTRAAPGAADCLAAPNREPDVGQHWYFHTDRATNQKCWYLREQDNATTGSVDGSASAQPQAPQPSETAVTSARTQKALFRDFLRWYKEHGGSP